MFAERSRFPDEPHAFARALASARSSRALLDLTVSNPTGAALPYDEAAIRAALARPEAIRYEPAPFGIDAARAAVATRIGHDASRVILTASTSEAYGYLLKLVCDPGDEVLVPRPSYPLFAFLAQLEGVRLVPYDLAYDGEWHVDLPSVARAIGRRTRAILAVSPNNPTGSYLHEDERERLQDHGLPLFVDEVFAAYPLELASPPNGAACASRGLVVSLSGLSKLAALPQMKLAWMALAGDAPLVDAAMERLETIADTYLSVATPVQLGAGALLDAALPTRAAIRARTRTNLDALDRRIAGTAVSRRRVEGGWYAVVRLPSVRDEEAWVLSLLDDGVVAQPGWFYDFVDGPFLVLSLLTEEATFDEGLARLVANVERAIR